MDRLPGFRDFYPAPLPSPDLWSADARQHLFSAWREVCRRYGFREYDGPPLEPVELFTTKSGEEILGQLYTFRDKGDREVGLRPEMTPTLARMVAAHARGYKKPLKWFAIPQLFRYERQQKGRLREHFQFNADIIGESDPAADSELIALLIDSLRQVGLSSKDVVVRLSSRTAWQEFYRSRELPAEREQDFYQTIDKLERETPQRTQAQLINLGVSMEEVSEFIDQARPTPDLGRILDNLAQRGLGDFAQVDYRVIRGLAYYTGPVFEVFDRQREFRAVAGGGRYDNLVKLISGGRVDMPALGFGMGDVVLSELLKARGLLPSEGASLDLFFLIEDEDLRADSLALMQRLREAGCAVDYCLAPMKSDKQFRRALECGAQRSVLLERDANGNIRVRVKHLKERSEQTWPVEEALERLRPGLVTGPQPSP